jgi:hypothetical protein
MWSKPTESCPDVEVTLTIGPSYVGPGSFRERKGLRVLSLT